jgi:hypothetical protein
MIDPWPEDLLESLGVTRAQMEDMDSTRELLWGEIFKVRRQLADAEPSEEPAIRQRLALLEGHECFRFPWIMKCRRVPLTDEEIDEIDRRDREKYGLG